MTTLEKIVASLQALTDEKKAQLTAKYTESSQWLENELKIIRSLIERNPRDDLVEKQPVALPIVNEVENPSKKRKSPEIPLNPVKLSPEQKRASLNVEDLCIAAGLPSDLNRLKKEQLLEEIEKRQEFLILSGKQKNATIKALKKDLVELLLEVLVAEKKVSLNSNDNSNYQYNQVSTNLAEKNTCSDANIEEVATVPESDVSNESHPPLSTISSGRLSAILINNNTDLNSSTINTPQRKGSLMNEFRNLITSANNNTHPNDSARASVSGNDLQDDVKKEFKARQSRQRDSQIRKSQILSTPGRTTIDCSDDCNHKNADVVEDIQTHEEEESPDMVISPEKRSTQDNNEVEVENPLKHQPEEESDEKSFEAQEGNEDSQNEDKNEVQEDQQEEGEVEDSDSHDMIGDDNKKDEIEQTNAVQSVVNESVTTNESQPIVEPLPAVENEIEEKVPAPTERVIETPTVITKKESTASQSSKVEATTGSGKSSARSSLVKVSSATNVPGAKKPVISNLVTGGQTSFLDKNPPKPVIAALEKAKQAKAIEDAKIAAKKQQQQQQQTTGVNRTLNSSLTKSSAVSNAPATTNTGIVKKTSQFFNSLKPVFTNGSNAVTKTPNFNQSTAPVAPAKTNNDEILRDITHTAVTTPAKSTNNVAAEATSATQKVSAQPMAPVTPQQPSQQYDEDDGKEYVIEDRPSSDEEGSGSESGTDDEAERKKQESIPDWAKGQKLKEALERQYGLHGHKPMDPDDIFPEVQTCSLEEIFGTQQGQNRKYNHRTSSAMWDADKLTLVEKRQYRQHMGYEPIVATSTSQRRII